MITGYTINENIKGLVENKRLAIVGPAKYLTSTNFGSIINSYDIVVRVNNVIPFNYLKDYGSRTDIIYHCCNSKGIGAFEEQLNKDSIVTSNIKYVICPGTIIDSHNGISLTENFNKINTFNIPFYHVGKNNYTIVKRELNCEGNTGITGLLDILQYPIKELLITGYSFYKEGNNIRDCYNSDYLKEYCPTKFNPANSHNINRQLNYFKTTILSKYYDIITIDSYMNTVLSLKYNKHISYLCCKQ